MGKRESEEFRKRMSHKIDYRNAIDVNYTERIERNPIDLENNYIKYSKMRKEEPKEEPKKKSKIKLSKKGKMTLAATGVALTALFGYKIYDNSQKGNEPITIEQALENGDSLETLGINQGIQDKIVDLGKRLENENITNQDIIEMATEIKETQFELIKTKIAKEYNKTLEKDESKIQSSEIEVKPESFSSNGEKNQNAQILVNGETVFSGSDISDDIRDMIQSAENMNINEGLVNTKDLNQDKYIKAFKKYVKEMDEFAAKEIKIEDGTIQTKVTKVKDLDKKEEKTAKLYNTDVPKEGTTINYDYRNSTSPQIEDDEMEL